MKKVQITLALTMIAMLLLGNVAQASDTLHAPAADPPVVTQIAMVLDGSNSIDPNYWPNVVNGLAAAVENAQCIPPNGTVELSVIQFGGESPSRAQLEVAPTVITGANAASLASQIRAIPNLRGFTPMAAGINLAADTLFASPNFSPAVKQVIDLVTDGEPNLCSAPGSYIGTGCTGNEPRQSAVTARNNAISKLSLSTAQDEFDVEAVDITNDNFTWLRDNIVYPQPGHTGWPPVYPGWIVEVESAAELASIMCGKFQAVLFEEIELVKTVGTDPTVCADTDEITVNSQTEVTYCYTVTNTGNWDLNVHTVEDDQLGVLLDEVDYTLSPGASFWFTASAVISHTTTNVATWSALRSSDCNCNPAKASDSATVNVPPPSISLTKTVGVDPNVCATTDSITVYPYTEVTYCYEVTNTGGYPLNSHDLSDTELGDILSGFAYDLLPGASVFLTQTATISQTTVNTATWTASHADLGVGASDSDSAEVIVPEPSIELTKTVGLDPQVCAASSAIEVAPYTDVYYCYTVKNTSPYTLPLHNLKDSELGTILYGFEYALGPGESIDTVAAGLVVGAPIDYGVITNTATWTGYYAGGPSAEAEASATVTVPDPTIEVTKTVSTESDVCGDSDTIEVFPGSFVEYCYTVKNTSPYTLPLADVSEVVLYGPGDGRGFVGYDYWYVMEPVDLGPGDSYQFLLSDTIWATTINTATWTLYYPGGPSVSASDVAQVTVPTPSIELTKTVGLDPQTCATTNDIIVPLGQDVTYCYTVKNTSPYTLPLHTLNDDELGLILQGSPYDLGPGESTQVLITVSAFADSINTAVWTGYLCTPYSCPGPQASASDQARVTVQIPTAVTLDNISASSDNSPAASIPLATLPAVVGLAAAAAFLLRRR